MQIEFINKQLKADEILKAQQIKAESDKFDAERLDKGTNNTKREEERKTEQERQHIAEEKHLQEEAEKRKHLDAATKEAENFVKSLPVFVSLDSDDEQLNTGTNVGCRKENVATEIGSLVADPDMLFTLRNLTTLGVAIRESKIKRTKVPFFPQNK